MCEIHPISILCFQYTHVINPDSQSQVVTHGISCGITYLDNISKFSAQKPKT